MPQFRDSFYELVPPWLRTGNAERYLYTLELMRDLLMEKANQAQKIRLPGQGDPSQIPFLAFDRQLVQGPLESNPNFIDRLKGAFETWNKAGSAIAVLGQLQAYAQGRQTYNRRQFVIVSNQRTLVGGTRVNQWWQLNYSTPLGDTPLNALVPHNFDWDGDTSKTWRAWLVIFQYLDAATLSGSNAQISTASGGSFVAADAGEEVDGVWVPKSSGTALNAPFLTVAGLSGLLPSHVGSMLTLSGSVNPTNNGTFQIAYVITASACIIVNKEGVPLDAGPLDWELATYPWIPPGPAWGTPGMVWGEGEGSPPPIDTGSNVGGVWKPGTIVGVGERPTFSWGLYIDALEIETLRNLTRTWKSAGTYYPNIIVAYDGEDGAYSRTSGEGTGNPDGTFGPLGSTVDGVFVPTRLISSPYNAFCQGTGRAVACSVENMT